jgi:hypothetical protein
LFVVQYFVFRCRHSDYMRAYIELTVVKRSVWVAGSREDAVLLGCWYSAHNVVEDKARAKYEKGLLRITIPLKQTPKGKKIKIE